MKFIKVGKNYMIKGSNGRIVSEKEKLELENKELILKDIKSNECQGKTTQKLSKNKKKIKELEKEEKMIDLKEELDKHLVDYWKNKNTALKEEVQDDTIEETNKSI